MDRIEAHRKRVQRALETLDLNTLSHMTRPKKPSPYAGLRQLKRIEIQADLAWAECGVTMDQLVKATLKLGRVPLVVPEFKEISVGGAVMGAALESSSFRHGQFNDICDRFELLQHDGRPLSASPGENGDLFYGVPGSYGSIAQLTMAAVRLAPAKPFVQVDYHRYKNVHEGLEALPSIWQEATQYLEGVILPNKELIWMPAKGASRAANPVPLSRPWSEWFIQHLLNSPKQKSDTFAHYDYLFRWDRAAFWMGRYATWGRSLFKYLFRIGLDDPELAANLRQTSLNPSLPFRMLFNWRLSSHELYKVLHQLPEQTFFIQDYYLPIDQVAEFVDAVLEKTQITPLWLCPIRGTQSPQWFSPHHGKGRFVNVGVYGMLPPGIDTPLLTQEFEQLCYKLGGRKMLYGVNTYSKEEFWQIYPEEKHQELTHKYRSDRGRGFYDLAT